MNYKGTSGRDGKQHGKSHPHASLWRPSYGTHPDAGPCSENWALRWTEVWTTTDAVTSDPFGQVRNVGRGSGSATGGVPGKSRGLCFSKTV